ncbi:BCS1 N terminal-domain-containing protein [Aspergillus leporis]|uniref:BCS1 N terminal-domain-containing protein n=1 Tax=Aspergillus leporis TaxID=41062 RepID=A0A5N5WRB8_9EURO|nr:BCS1 N terminal-domain-containing protein [Aspergillus leporis]
MDSSFGKFFYFSYFAVGSYIAKSLLDQYGTVPLGFFYSSIEVQSHDDAYNYLLYWLTKQRFNETKNRLIASTSLTSGMEFFGDSDSNDGNDDFLDVEESSDTEWKASLANTRQLLWSPSEGTHYFKYFGRYLALSREMEENRSTVYTRTEKLRISCLGWDASILKQLLLEARVEYSQKEKGKTIIYRGAKRAYDNEFYWARSTARPARPLSTVILDREEKSTFIRDVQQYLHPSTMRWYSDRGIPYRRGYLFYGLPGTGKSSLAFAAGGFLGLNVYILDLNANQLTEDALAQLFQELPRRCLVLLEDIDTNEVTSRRGSKKKRKGNNKVSLSALLNTIDGVAAQEGRVLIMTTNHPEHLDPALVRPGRVDYQIEFKLANRDLMMQMFQNLFRDAPPVIESHYEDSEIGALEAPRSEKVPLLPAPEHALSLRGPPSPSEIDMEQLAAAFAEKIPELTFSPAEIQGYLLRHKYSPQDAIAEVEAWVEKTLDEKKQKSDAEAAKGQAKERKKAKGKKNKKGKKSKKDEGDKDENENSNEEEGSSSSESESDEESSSSSSSSDEDDDNKSKPNGVQRK